MMVKIAYFTEKQLDETRLSLNSPNHQIKMQDRNFC